MRLSETWVDCTVVATWLPWRYYRVSTVRRPAAVGGSTPAFITHVARCNRFGAISQYVRPLCLREYTAHDEAHAGHAELVGLLAEGLMKFGMFRPVRFVPEESLLQLFREQVALAAQQIPRPPARDVKLLLKSVAGGVALGLFMIAALGRPGRAQRQHAGARRPLSAAETVMEQLKQDAAQLAADGSNDAAAAVFRAYAGPTAAETAQARAAWAGTYEALGLARNVVRWNCQGGDAAASRPTAVYWPLEQHKAFVLVHGAKLGESEASVLRRCQQSDLRIEQVPVPAGGYELIVYGALNGDPRVNQTRIRVSRGAVRGVAVTMPLEGPELLDRLVNIFQLVRSRGRNKLGIYCVPEAAGELRIRGQLVHITARCDYPFQICYEVIDEPETFTLAQHQ